ncbi:TauD/TfdA family dioxygenase [Limnohabitans sp. 2KL-51]|uniref:TauD/TfdA dioxygenase family protein n=1 Tax=Limnohabitans sp. 2KL-51 TaxID=1977911 RepID=UPI000D363927|nr:TauD/TfdA family dioxygenase [Limnohabitans sp. 2KL-51]PUE49632.1 taurine catabolism dioxygenase [Limnohabitans sp. 2KL-51]
MSSPIQTSAAYQSFVAKPFTPNIGATLHGLDLSQSLSDLAQTELKAALARYEVIFFRDQKLTTAQQVAFTRSFGHVQEVKAFFPRVASQPEIEIVESTAERPAANNNWHSDITWQANPPIGTSLYAQVIPASGGDTVWASMTTAYDALPADFKAYLETLSAMHTWEVTGWTEYLLRQDATGEQLQAARAKYPPVTHPVVRVHPVTGKKILYVNPTFTTHIHGLPRAQSDALLAQLFALITAPEVQARWRWQPDTLAVWDNRSTQHYAVADFYPQHRKLHRITFTADQAF